MFIVECLKISRTSTSQLLQIHHCPRKTDRQDNKQFFFYPTHLCLRHTVVYRYKCTNSHIHTTPSFSPHRGHAKAAHWKWDCAVWNSSFWSLSLCSVGRHGKILKSCRLRNGALCHARRRPPLLTLIHNTRFFNPTCTIKLRRAVFAPNPRRLCSDFNFRCNVQRYVCAGPSEIRYN